MGWYIICQICGKEGRKGPDCRCYQKEAKRIYKKQLSSTLLNSFDYEDEVMIVYCVDTFRGYDGIIFYIRSIVHNNSDEYKDWREVVELDEKQYEEEHEVKQKLINLRNS